MAESHAVAGGQSSSTSTDPNQRSQVRVNTVIPPNTAITVNGAQTETTHVGDTGHDLGANDAALQASLGATVFININGIPEPITWHSANQFRVEMELRPKTVVDVESPPA